MASTNSSVTDPFSLFNETGAYGDPYLAILPAFRYSMPVQVLILGVTITLLCLLCVHLLFTIRYHLPLSRLNYICQLVAVAVTTANVCVEIHTCISSLENSSKVWPYMFEYVEVEVVPPSSSSYPKVGLICLGALNSLVVHFAHIQFLTLLFPSVLEMMLIGALLGPLALASSFLFFASLSGHAAVIDLCDAVRAIATSTLTLLYTLALWVWGFYINRTRAWRGEGGTAAFGAIALMLGLCGTALNFYQVHQERMGWLVNLIRCILVWQSWVAFWWWVGSGMWAGEAADVQKRETKRRERRSGKRMRKEQASEAASQSSGQLRHRRARPGPQNPNETSGSQTSASNEISGSHTSATAEPTDTGYLSSLVKVVRSCGSQLKRAHNRAAVERAAYPLGISDEAQKSWGIRALMMYGKKERGHRRREAMGDDAIEKAENRASFVIDGAVQLDSSQPNGNEQEWEDLSMQSSSEPSRVGTDEAGTSWFRTQLNKWRLKDVSKF